MKTNDFLFEILTEELPPKNLQRLSGSLMENIQSALTACGLHFTLIEPFASPRRLAVLVSNLVAQQPDQSIEKRGPALNVAFDAQGKPTKACEGFAHSCGTRVDKLETLKTDKGSWVIFKNIEPGKLTTELLPNIVSDAIKKLPISKPMRWGSHAHEFVRPVHSVIMLYGKKVVPTTLFGQKASNTTKGHRFLSEKILKIDEPKNYSKILKENGFVIANFSERKLLIQKQLDKISKKLKGKFIADEKLMDEVTALVEWPVALLANFPERFLKLPKEVLISSMQGHQKSFPIASSSGELLNHFITVSNLISKDAQQVILGNERVMNARLSDAEFFYHEDLKIPLKKWGEQLDRVIFEKQLGTLADKTGRLMELTKHIAKLADVHVHLAQSAAKFSKCDLMTNMVGEFPELQGVMGKYYAEHENLPHEVAIALNEQYMPRHAGDALPQTRTGLTLGIADRLDTLIGIFGINKMPTGEKDPFALRRAALSILRMLIECELSLDLIQLLEQAQSTFKIPLKNNQLTKQVFDFIMERFKSYAVDHGFSIQQFSAVAAKNIRKPLDFYHRIEAVKQFAQLPEAQSLAIANKRVNNILQKQTMDFSNKRIKTALLQEGPEMELATQVMEKMQSAKSFYKDQEYVAVLTNLATLKKPIDMFFDSIMVMTDDEKIRENRLTLLTQLRELFSLVADISLLHIE